MSEGKTYFTGNIVEKENVGIDFDALEFTSCQQVTFEPDEENGLWVFGENYKDFLPYGMTMICGASTIVIARTLYFRENDIAAVCKVLDEKQKALARKFFYISTEVIPLENEILRFGAIDPIQKKHEPSRTREEYLKRCKVGW